MAAQAGVALGIVALVLAGCLTTHEILVGPGWSLVEVGGVSPAAEAELTFHPDGTFEGSPGCNSITGFYHLEGNRIVLDDGTGIAAMSCGAAIDAQERSVMAVFGGRPAYAFDTGTGHLRMTSDGGVLVFEPR